MAEGWGDSGNPPERRIVGPVRGIGRDQDGITGLHIYHADAVASASTIRQLRETVARQALEIGRLKADKEDLAQELAGRPRWYVLRRPTWSAPERLLGLLALAANLAYACRSYGARR